MECARKMWDQFSSGASVHKQRRMKHRAQEQARLDAEQEKCRNEAKEKKLAYTEIK